MQEIITVDANKCIGCNACVRVCPVHANVTKAREGEIDKFFTTVDYDKCINCGECVKACGHEARSYIDDIERFKTDLENGKALTLVVAPAIRTSFPNNKWKALLAWIRNKGNCRIYDVGYGADICTYMHAKYIESHPGARIMTQPCPAIVNYVQMYKPELIKNLSPVLSPAGCTAAYLRTYANDRNTMYMLSPCLAKTSESRREKVFDFNVTFRRLEEYAMQNGLNWNNYNFEFDSIAGDPAEGTIGRIYPMPGGLKETLLMVNRDLVIRTAEGPHTVYDRLNRYAQTSDNDKPDVLDVLNCEHGCNHGTATPTSVADLMTVETIMDDISATSIKELAGNRFGFGRMKRFKSFEKTLHLEDFLTSYTNHQVYIRYPNEAELNTIFNTMLKTTEEDKCINCGACGYKTCHDMATAIFLGMNVRENCIHYLKHSLRSDYDAIKATHIACAESINIMNQVCVTIQRNQSDMTVAANEIDEKAKSLIDNINRLQAFTQTCLNHYGDIPDVDLKPEDFGKMKQFVSAIGTMSATYREMTQGFIGQSSVIKDRTNTLFTTIESLVAISNDLRKVISEDGDRK